MSKTYEELATEITVAWVKAVGDATAAGKFDKSWLELNSVTNVYKRVFKTINESHNLSPE